MISREPDRTHFVRHSMRMAKTWPWIPIALAEGLTSTWVLSLFQLHDTSSHSLAIICISMLVQTWATYVLIIGAARSWLRGESVIRSIKWTMSASNLSAWTFPVLVGTGVIFMISGSGFHLYSDDLSVISTGTVIFAVASGLARLYKSEYVEVVNPAYDESVKDPKRRIRRFLTVIFGVAPHQLPLPLLQAIVAVVIPSLLLVQLGVSATSLTYSWATALATTFVPVWGVVWAEWHLRGGLMRILRLGHGRPLDPAVKPVKTVWNRLGHQNG